MNRRALEESAGPVIAGLVVLVTLILILGFAVRDPRPHDVPVGVVAPPSVAQQLTNGFAQAAPGAFSFASYPSEAEARAAIDRREVVGAVLVGQGGPRLVVAAGAGEALSGGVTTAFTNAFQSQGTPLVVEAVHPMGSGDPHGIVLFFLVLSTIVGSVIAGALISVGAGNRSWAGSVAVLATFAALSGTCGALTAAWLANGYGDAIWLVMALAGLLSLAVAAAVAAMGRLFGPAGIGLAALVILPIGLISSGGPLGSEFLPDVYRAIAPWLPVAPAYSALRGALYFDGAGLAQPIALLAGWVLVAIALLAAPRLQHQANAGAELAHA